MNICIKNKYFLTNDKEAYLLNIDELKKVGLTIEPEHKTGKLIIDVFTVWCGPCKFIAPILHKLRDEKLIKLIQVDLDQNRELGEMFGIQAIPTLLFFKDGKLVEKNIEVNNQALVADGKMVGAAGEPILRKIIAQM